MYEPLLVSTNKSSTPDKSPKTQWYRWKPNSMQTTNIDRPVVLVCVEDLLCDLNRLLEHLPLSHTIVTLVNT